MWVEEEYPEYAYEDSDYEDAENISDVRVLRLLKTYHDLVAQRYNNAHPFPYKNFKLTKRHSKGRRGKVTERCLRVHARRYYNWLGDIGNELVDIDPAYFMAFVFEMWGNRKYYHIYKWFGWPEIPGVQFPSIHVICEYREELVKLFMDKENYRPKEFIPRDEHSKRRKEAIHGKVMRWCSTFGKTPFQYWTTPRHLHPDFTTVLDLDCAESFWELDAEFQKEFGVSAQEIRDNLANNEVILETKREKLYKKISARNNKLREQGLDPEYKYIISVPNYTHLSEYYQLRVDYCQRALNQGVDVTTEEFETKMEEAINPIAYDHPDTVMYYYYGIGDGPRRMYE